MKPIKQVIKEMGTGINIGNTFDAHNLEFLGKDTADLTVAEMEVAWQKGDPERLISMEYIKRIKEHGIIS